MKTKGRQPALNRRQVAHAKLCARIRGRISVKRSGRRYPATLRLRVTAVATAQRLGVHRRVLRRYVLGLEVPREDWLAGKRGEGPETHGIRGWPLSRLYACP
jgi:hypothetical protein